MQAEDARLLGEFGVMKKMYTQLQHLNRYGICQLGSCTGTVASTHVKTKMHAPWHVHQQKGFGPGGERLHLHRSLITCI